MAPFGVIYILNWILFIIIFVSLCRKKNAKSFTSGDKKGEMRKKLKQQFIIALTLSLLFGLGWGVGFAATTSISVLAVSATLQAIFIFLTGFQGVLIFVMQCVRSEDARKEWQRWGRAVTCNKITFELKKKPKSHSITSGEYTYRPKATANSYGTLSTSVDPNSETLRKAVKKDLESSTGESMFGTSTFVSTTMETIDEVEKKDLSLDKEEKVKYELLSRTESGDGDPPSPGEGDAAPADTSPPIDAALLPEVPISPTTKETIELVTFGHAVKLDPKKDAEFDVILVNPAAPTASDEKKPTANGGDAKVALPQVEMTFNADDLFGNTETAFLN